MSKDKFKEKAQEYVETFFILLFLANGIATFLILYGWIVADVQFMRGVGALAFAFSAIALVNFMHKGVRHSINNKK